MRYTLGDFETPRCFHESCLTLAISRHPVVRGHPICSCCLPSISADMRFSSFIRWVSRQTKETKRHGSYLTSLKPQL